MGGNLRRHCENIEKFGLPYVICINKFPTDTGKELEALTSICKQEGRNIVLSDHWALGGKGAAEMAEMVSDTVENQPANFKLLYSDEASCREKIETVAREIYRAKNVIFTEDALKQLPKNDYPVCIAKTQYSF